MAAILYESYYGIMPLTSDYVKHYQVKGAKHHVRRYQNYDGSLTPLGRDHYGVGPARDKVKTDKDRTAGDAQRRLGSTSNAITDAASRGASQKELVNATRRAMTQIDAQMQSDRSQKESVGDKFRNFKNDLAEGRRIAREEKAQAKAEKQAEKAEKAENRKIAREERADAKAKERIAKIVNSGNMKLIRDNASKLSYDQLKEAKAKAELVEGIKAKIRKDASDAAELAKIQSNAKWRSRAEKALAIKEFAEKGVELTKKIQDLKIDMSERAKQANLHGLELTNKIGILNEEIRKRSEAPEREREAREEAKADKVYKRAWDENERDYQRNMKKLETQQRWNMETDKFRADLTKYKADFEAKRADAKADREDKRTDSAHKREMDKEDRAIQREKLKSDNENAIAKRVADEVKKQVARTDSIVRTAADAAIKKRLDDLLGAEEERKKKRIILP